MNELCHAYGICQCKPERGYNWRHHRIAELQYDAALWSALSRRLYEIGPEGPNYFHFTWLQKEVEYRYALVRKALS